MRIALVRSGSELYSVRVADVRAMPEWMGYCRVYVYPRMIYGIFHISFVYSKCGGAPE